MYQDIRLGTHFGAPPRSLPLPPKERNSLLARTTHASTHTQLTHTHHHSGPDFLIVRAFVRARVRLCVPARVCVCARARACACLRACAQGGPHPGRANPHPHRRPLQPGQGASAKAQPGPAVSVNRILTRIPTRILTRMSTASVEHCDSCVLNR